MVSRSTFLPPALRPGEVLLRTQAVTICASDVHIYAEGNVGGTSWDRPFVPGHEAAGVVAEIGPGVLSVKPGDHVALIFLTQCGECEHCIEGRPSLCARGTQASTSAARHAA